MAETTRSPADQLEDRGSRPSGGQLGKDSIGGFRNGAKSSISTGRSKHSRHLEGASRAVIGGGVVHAQSVGDSPVSPLITLLDQLLLLRRRLVRVRYKRSIRRYWPRLERCQQGAVSGATVSSTGPWKTDGSAL